MTCGEKLTGLLFMWILIHPFLIDRSLDFTTVLDRIFKISLYIYAVRTFAIHSKKPNSLLQISAYVATAFATITMIYQFGVLEKTIGLRAIGESGYRVGSLEIGGFADLGNPILAALYYGFFASIFFGILTKKSKPSIKMISAIASITAISIFILLSGSRGPLIALLASGILALLFNKNTNKKLILVSITIASVVIIGFLHQEVIIQFDKIIESGFNGRFSNWSVAIKHIYSNPVGYGAYTEYVGATWLGSTLGHPHNMLLNVSYHWGIPAGLIFISVFVWCITKSIQHKEKTLMAISACILVFGQVGMITDTYSFIPRPDLQWLMYFFPIAFCFGSIKRTEIDNY